jgi:hypothetical protein
MCGSSIGSGAFAASASTTVALGRCQAGARRHPLGRALLHLRATSPLMPPPARRGRPGEGLGQGRGAPAEDGLLAGPADRLARSSRWQYRDWRDSVCNRRLMPWGASRSTSGLPGSAGRWAPCRPLAWTTPTRAIARAARWLHALLRLVLSRARGGRAQTRDAQSRPRLGLDRPPPTGGRPLRAQPRARRWRPAPSLRPQPTRRPQRAELVVAQVTPAEFSATRRCA